MPNKMDDYILISTLNDFIFCPYSIYLHNVYAGGMGYQIDVLEFYSISTNTTFPVAIPTTEDKIELQDFILRFKQYDPAEAIEININKCTHCIYCNLCDKIDSENVYS